MSEFEEQIIAAKERQIEGEASAATFEDLLDKAEEADKVERKQALEAYRGLVARAVAGKPDEGDTPQALSACLKNARKTPKRFRFDVKRGKRRAELEAIAATKKDYNTLWNERGGVLAEAKEQKEAEMKALEEKWDEEIREKQAAAYEAQSGFNKAKRAERELIAMNREDEEALFRAEMDAKPAAMGPFISSYPFSEEVILPKPIPLSEESRASMVSDEFKRRNGWPEAEVVQKRTGGYGLIKKSN